MRRIARDLPRIYRHMRCLGTAAPSPSPSPSPPIPPASASSSPSTPTARQRFKGPTKHGMAKLIDFDSMQSEFDAFKRTRQLARISVIDDKAAPCPYVFGDEAIVDIIAVATTGHGVGVDENGWTFIVPTVIQGERVQVRVIQGNGGSHGFSVAELLRVVEPSPLRVKPKCKYHDKCQACSLQHLPYEAQCQQKMKWLRGIVGASATELGLDPDALPITDIVPSPLQFGYRTKLTPHHDPVAKGQKIEKIGFTERGRLKTVVDIDYCPIATESVNNLYAEARRFLMESRPPLAQRGGTVILRNTLIPPHGTKSGTAPRPVSDSAWPPSGWTMSAMEDPNQIVVDTVGEYVFQYPARSFYQVNSSILPQLTSYVRQQLTEQGGDAVKHLLDVYCGSGLFAVTCAKGFESVVGIEIDRLSVAWAHRNAKYNGIGNCRFIEGQADRVFADVAVEGDSTAVIIDPPNKGCHPHFIEQLLDLKPRVIVYVACNPQSQVNDLKRFVAGGQYKIKTIQPFDMFPQTVQLETVVTLVRHDPIN